MTQVAASRIQQEATRTCPVRTVGSGVRDATPEPPGHLPRLPAGYMLLGGHTLPEGRGKKESWSWFLCTRLLLLGGDGVSDCTQREGERERASEKERERETEGGRGERSRARSVRGEIGRQTVADKVPNTQGGVCPIKFARLSSA